MSFTVLMIVALVSINVIHEWFVVGIRDKGLCNQSMNIEPFSFPFGAKPQPLITLYTLIGSKLTVYIAAFVNDVLLVKFIECFYRLNHLL